MRARGSTIIGALLFLAILLALGLAALSKGISRQRALAEARDYARARHIAEAGLEDVRSKLNLDIFFPPPELFANQLFSYTESMLTLDGTVQGYYTVTLDGRYAEAYAVYRIRSVGYAGADVDNPLAEARVEGDLDISEFVRGTTNPNPLLYEFRTRTE